MTIYDEMTPFTQDQYEFAKARASAKSEEAMTMTDEKIEPNDRVRRCDPMMTQTVYTVRRITAGFAVCRPEDGGAISYIPVGLLMKVGT